MKLYTNPASPNCRKVEVVIRHLDLDVERVLVDFADPEQRAALRALNPNDMVPTLVDGDTVLWESNAITPYLCGTVSDTSLWPKSNARYDIMRWMSWQLAHFGPAVDVFTWENMLKGVLGQGGPDAERLEAGRPRLERFLHVLDDHLAKRDVLATDSFTLADIAVGATLTYAEPAQVPLSDHRNVIAWRARLDDLKGWVESAPKM